MNFSETAWVKAGALKESLKDHLDIWREAVKADRLRPQLSPIGRAELAFLPAALEVSETPASPAARITALVIAAFFTLALAWASIGELDIVASATGKIIPSDRIQEIQPLETAIVRAVTVREGQEVKAGDTLVVLEIAGAGSDVGRLTAENHAARAEAARLAALLEPDPVKAFRPPADLPRELVDMHRALLAAALAEHKAKLAALSSDLAKRQAELSTIRTDLARLGAVETKIADETGRRRELADKGYGSQIDRLKVEKELAENQGSQLVQKAKLTEAAAAIESIRSQLNQAREEFRKETTTRLSEARTKAATSTQDLAKAADRQRVQTLTAPVDGIAQQIEVHTMGGVVTPAQKLLTIVPKGAALEVEAKLPNKDIAFVESGQHATIKVDAFPFTRYGTIDGQITMVSLNATRDEKDQDKEYTFPITVSLAQSAITVENGKRIPLTPGMSVTVEVKTGTRKPIEYVLAPLKKYGAESGRER
ncbi:MAG: HlyD family type I secretion periplasmic adaptor subunit [Alphaproteobacteria bacterium]|nr:HlyD family type I secretion periplasmic adaptor subunit [Alphaproteobacteria bacterium]